MILLNLRRAASCWTAPLILLLALSPSLWSERSGNGLVEGATKKKIDTSKLSRICSGKPSITANDKRAHTILEKLAGVTSVQSLEVKGSSVNAAACWLIHDDQKKMKASHGQFIQRFALAVFWFGTDGVGHWRVKTDWMSKKDECLWFGITCTRNWFGRKHITDLDLGFNDCHGLLPRELGLLTHLIDVDLHGNEIQGVLSPYILAGWKNVQTLRLHMNDLFGNLPKEINLMTNLRELSLFGNYFSGEIPKSLEKLVNLQSIDLYANNFHGKIPANFAKLKKLSE